MRVLGVDPGLEGALAIVEDGALIWAAKIPWLGPIEPVGGAQAHPFHRLDAAALYDTPSSEWQSTGGSPIWIEQPLVKDGSRVGNPITACGFGQLITVLDRLHAPTYPMQFVRPETWQQWAFAGLKRQIQTDAYRSIGLPAEGLKDETLWFSRLAALIYFGEEAVRRWCVPAGSRVLHDGLTDAALIALYGWAYRERAVDRALMRGWQTVKLQAAWPEFFQAKGAPLPPSTTEVPFPEDA